MGDTLWIDVEGRDSGELPADNSILLRLERQLAALAVKLGVPKLSDFYAYERGWFQRWRWFDPATALPSVVAIRNHLERSPEDLGFEPSASRRHWPESLMKELLECRQGLEAAGARKKRFRFLIVS